MAGRTFSTRDFPGEPARKPRSSVRVSFDKAHQKMVPSGVQVGKKHTFQAIGTVTGMQAASDYSGPSMEMDLSGFKHGALADAPTPINQSIESSAGGTLSSALRARHANRHPASGQFVPKV